MKIKLFKKKKNFKKKDFAFNTNLYWKVAVGGSLVVIVLSSAYGYVLFKDISREFALPAGNEDQSIIVREDRINKALDYFSQKEEKSVEILGSPDSVVDPSL